MKKTLTKLVAMLMVAAMAFSFVGFMPREANAAPVSILENDSPARKRSSEPAAEPDEIVPIIVKLKDVPVLAKTDVSNERSAEMSKALAAKQDKLFAAINKKLVKGGNLEISYHYTLLFNGFSFRGEYRLIEEIKKLNGVEDCYRAAEYELPEDAKPDGNPTKLSTSVGFINADDMWALGYTGQGQTIAVIDTGIKVNHTNFATAPQDPHFDAAGIQSVLNRYDLCAEERYNGTLTGATLYHSAKLPFTFNYYAGNTDVSHANAGSDHGTHVSSIAAGCDSSSRGVAYNAQIISMQVFQNGGAAWTEILAALEDCAWLEVDALNMSLGSDNGFTQGEADMEEVFALLTAHGVNCAVAAGNSGTAGSGNNYGSKQPTFNMDNGVVASPSTLGGSLSVAASSNSSSATPTSYSSWGTTADLSIKPEIMAPGDNIRAATDSQYSYSNYGTKSGTSMASPHIAGSMVLVNQYVNTAFPSLSEQARMEMVNTLLMSTAVPSKSGNTPYSPRWQGAGQANLTAAINTKAYIEVEGSLRPKIELGDDDNRTGIFNFSFGIVNFGSTAKTYTPTVYVLTENTGTVSIGGQSYYTMAGSASNITNNVNVTVPQSVTVPANGRTTVNVTVNVSGYAATLNEKFPNGAYIEGFVTLAGDVNLSVPYLGFYGDWEKASVLDRDFYYDQYLGNGDPIPAEWGINTAGSSIGGENYIAFGENPFTDTENFLFDRASISPNGDGKMDAVDTAYNYLLRNCEYFEYSIVNAQTNEEYYNLQVPWARKCSAKSWYTDIEPLGTYEEELPDWDGSNLPNGTTVKLRMTAYMHSYDEFNPSANECAYWEIPITVDTQEPEVVYWNMQNGQLMLYVSDNHYVSYVGIYSDSACTNLITSAAVEETTRGALTMLEFDIGNRTTVYAKVGDYAYNISTAQITEGEGGSLEPVELQGISFAEQEIETYQGFGAALNIVREPANANNYEVVWTSANENIATVRGGMTKATVTGVAEGTTTVTATATDKDTGASFTATISVTVNYYPNLNDALNVQGGNLNFVSTGTYAWQIDMTTFSARLAGASTNSGAGNSQSAVTMDTVHLSAGDKLTFAWAVSSEANYDKLKFYVNGNVVENISGETTIWNRYEYTAPSDGNYIFKWSYEKDSSVNKGQDKGWVDDISITYVNPPYTLGDVDNDGRITISDALMTMRYAMGTAALTDTQILAADFDGNGTVSITDATMILRAAMIAD